jgi:hypothetical protein
MNCTQHAYERAKERLGWNAKVLDRMITRAFTDGVKHSGTKGTLKKYVTKLWGRNKNANNIRIYGENVYLFCGETLVSIYQLENKLIKHLQYCKQ